MATVILTQLDNHAPWAAGEIVTVQVVRVDGAAYFCTTLETYPPDLKARHEEQLVQLQADHQEAVGELRARHQAELEEIRSSLAKAAIDSPA